MNYLTGLEWSAGLFGLSIGVLIGAVCTWKGIQDNLPQAKPCADMSLNELPTMDLTVYGDVPAVPPCNPLHARMFERWLEAEGMGDRFIQNRQEGRMLLAGIEPPVSRDEAESRLAMMKGTEK